MRHGGHQWYHWYEECRTIVLLHLNIKLLPRIAGQKVTVASYHANGRALK